MSSVIKAHDIAPATLQPPPIEPVPVAPPAVEETANVQMVARLFLNSAPLEYVAMSRAETILADARRDADAIVEAAEAERAAIIEAAREEGFAAGHEQGREEALSAGEAELQARLQLLANVCMEAAHARDKFIRHHQGDIVELAVALAAKLTRRSGGLDADTARALLSEMLPRTTGIREVKITLHPDDLEKIRAETETVAALVDEQTRITWIADEWLSSGSVFVETERGSLDGTLRTRAQRLVAQLLDVIEHGD